LTGTDDQIIKNYLALGEQLFEKVKPKHVQVSFQNKTTLKAPPMAYKGAAAMELIKEELQKPDNMCWLTYEKDDEIWEQHYLCDWGPAHPP